MTDCIFCKIARHEVPSRIVFENERLLAFHDLFPAAPTHILLIPKSHYTTLNDVPASEAVVLGELMTTAAQIARDNGFADDGYRVVMNCNSDGGQSVYHIHLHLLAGRKLTWPPG
ncbi:histidine triad nucleotide-binding protein [Perlucidibaca piscinae]|uniref:histidine triad nucleotide-binding protein n=1 Tax=Perlucidibaca piscinae TaxID=392589 RepID=UPI0003B3DBF6|nr:histidine triad nucleotide-binding protein [Perlucidibaca piscinae]